MPSAWPHDPLRAVARWLVTALLAVTAAAQGKVQTRTTTATATATVRVQSKQEAEAERHGALLRAMVVLKLAPYVSAERPGAAPRKEYRIAVVGNDPAAAAIVRTLPHKKVDDAAVRVFELPLAKATTGEQAGDYELLYVAGSVPEDALRRIVANHAKKPVLLVCERAGFAELGGGIQLFIQDNCVRFEVNAEALRANGLRVNSQLLKLSRRGPT